MLPKCLQGSTDFSKFLRELKVPKANQVCKCSTGKPPSPGVITTFAYQRARGALEGGDLLNFV